MSRCGAVLYARHLSPKRLVCPCSWAMRTLMRTFEKRSFDEFGCGMLAPGQDRSYLNDIPTVCDTSRMFAAMLSDFAPSIECCRRLALLCGASRRQTPPSTTTRASNWTHRGVHVVAVDLQCIGRQGGNRCRQETACECLFGFLATRTIHE